MRFRGVTGPLNHCPTRRWWAHTGVATERSLPLWPVGASMSAVRGGRWPKFRCRDPTTADRSPAHPPLFLVAADGTLPSLRELPTAWTSTTCPAEQSQARLPSSLGGTAWREASEDHFVQLSEGVINSIVCNTCGARAHRAGPGSCRRANRKRAASWALRRRCTTVSVLLSAGLTTEIQPSAP